MHTTCHVGRLCAGLAVVATLPFLLSRSSLAGEQYPEVRPDVVSRVVGELQKERSQTGRAPTEAFLHSAIRSLKGDQALHHLDARRILEAYAAMQSCPISKADLLALCRSRRNSLADFKVSVAATHQEQPSRGMQLASFTYDLTMSGDRIRIDRRGAEGVASSGGPISTVTSYDGKRVLSVDIFTKGTPNATLSPLASRDRFFQVDSPLARLSMLNSAADAGRVILAHDLVAFLETDESFIQELPETVDGIDCLVVSNLSIKFFLGIQFDYAVCRVEEFGAFYNKADNTVLPRTTITSWTNGAWKDFGNGLWLPATSRFTRQEGGTPVLDISTTYKWESVNEPIDPARFSDFIPEGSLVYDTINKTTFLMAPGTSIESTLSAVVKPEPSRTYTRLVTINGVLLAVLLLAWLLSRIRSVKRQ